MIKVNLLPPEHRKVEGTPVARLVTTVASVMLVAGVATWWAVFHFGALARVRDDREEKEQDLASLKAQAERSEALLREFKEYQRRRDTIEKIGASRILWSKKLDEMADLIHDKGDVKRHLVWLKSIRTGNGRFPTSPVQLVIQGLSGGDQFHKLADFNADIKKSEDFFPDFYGIDPPDGRQVPLEDGNVPDAAWEFSFGLDLKQPNWREKQ
jgi:hypothetical protein